MAAPAKARSPYDVTLSAAQYKALAEWLIWELQNALDAKSTQDDEVDYWHTLYEQARTRIGRNQPWPDAADLTSYLACEKTDAIHARILRTVFTEPIWSVEGWGDAADRAPFVEEFHQWKAEEERLQNVIDRLALISLIEPRGLIEVSEGTETRLRRKQISAKIQTDPITGGMAFDEQAQPTLAVDPQGKYQDAGPQDLAAETVIDDPEPVRKGPVYRILPYRDSAILPGHARDKEDVWGYFKRFWKRYSDLQRQAEDGIYDAESVEKMTAQTDKEPDAALQRSKMAVAPPVDELNAEKELWEGTILLDLNALFDRRSVPRLRDKAYGGARWYVVTLHLPSMQLLRVQHDDLERARYVPVILFPRPDRCTEGFSLIGHKLITTIEEHTAVRNMRADRASMTVQAPIKRQVGALWDPLEQPWGPKAVIDVRDMHELEAVVVPDVTQPLIVWQQDIERSAERLVGVNDIASGQVSQDARTLGEIQMATEQSFVRMDLIVRRFQEAMEELFQIRHAIWKRTLAEQPDGVQPPQSMMASLEGRGVSIDQYLPNGKITAQLLDGAFRGKPSGSVQNADPAKRRADWMQFLGILPGLLQTMPLPGQNPMVIARAVWRETLRAFQIQNTQAFIGTASQDLQQTQMLELMPMLQQLMGGQPPPMGMGGSPGLPAGPMSGPPPAIGAAPGGPPMSPPLAPGPQGPQ